MLAKILRAAGLALLLCAPDAVVRAEGLLRLDHCRIVDDRGPVKAMGVNYVDGFWNFAADGKREAYLPFLDALAQAKIPFIRFAFGPWAKHEGPPAPQIGDFIAHRDRYFDRLDTFLADLKARRIGAVLDVFWNVDPYTTYFDEPATARARPDSRTAAFLNEVVSELARRHGRDPTIWMIEFLNEGNLDIDFPRAAHSRADLVALVKGLAVALRGAGDRHLVGSGNSLPRPAAERLHRREGWAPDRLDDFYRALDDETPVDVASVHVYPETAEARPWDDGDVLNMLPRLVAHSRRVCRPVFVGEFGAKDPEPQDNYVARIAQSDIPLAAVWGFGRPSNDPMAFGVDARGRVQLAHLAGR